MSFTHPLLHPHRINSASNPLWMDALRIMLGLFLFIKGILFLEHTKDVFFIFSQHQSVIGVEKASILTSSVHIVGGLMIAFGFLTRLSLLCQIPILLGAVMIVNPHRNAHTSNMDLWLSIVVLTLLVFFMIVGPGRYSVDNKLLRQKQPDQLNE